MIRADNYLPRYAVLDAVTLAAARNRIFFGISQSIINTIKAAPKKCPVVAGSRFVLRRRVAIKTIAFGQSAKSFFRNCKWDFTPFGFNKLARVQVVCKPHVFGKSPVLVARMRLSPNIASVATARFGSALSKSVNSIFFDCAAVAFCFVKILALVRLATKFQNNQPTVSTANLFLDS